MPHYEDIETAWKVFKDRSHSERSKYFMNEDGSIQSLLMSQQMTLPMLDHLCQTSDAIRELADNKLGAMFLKQLLPHKSLLAYFRQPSKRTRTSFVRAAQLLGMATVTDEDADTSSEVKGETPLDACQTSSEYFDVMAIRHPERDFVEKVAWHLKTNTRRPVGIVNGGSGPDQHPTQALLDYYTVARSKGWENVRNYVCVGDLARSRTVRSGCYLLRYQSHVHVIFVAPEQHQVLPDILEYLTRHGVSYELKADLKSVIHLADVVYMTRVQDEHDTHGESKRYYPEATFGPDELARLRNDAIVMHPLPRRDELDARCDTNERVKIWSQVRNGMWMRAAVFANMFGVDHEILDMYSQVYRKGVKA